MTLIQKLVKKTFTFMGASLVCALTFKVIEGNYSMIAPHLQTLYGGISWILET